MLLSKSGTYTSKRSTVAIGGILPLAARFQGNDEAHIPLFWQLLSHHNCHYRCILNKNKCTALSRCSHCWQRDSANEGKLHQCAAAQVMATLACAQSVVHSVQPQRMQQLTHPKIATTSEYNLWLHKVVHFDRMLLRCQESYCLCSRAVLHAQTCTNEWKICAHGTQWPALQEP